MRWPSLNSRAAVMARRLRGRFGIAAPQVTVRTEIPWYMRAVGLAITILFVIAFAGWAYDAGRRVAGFDHGESAQILEQLRSQKASLEEEVARLRTLLTASESNLQIERAAQQRLSEKHGALVQENNKLKEDLAVFERLARFEGKQDDDVALDQVSIRPDASKGAYRYSFLIALQGARRGKEAKFNLQLVVSPRGQPGSAKIVLPYQDAADLANYELVLRNFRRIEGRFVVPAGVIPAAVEVRILEAGRLKASQNATL